MIDKTELDYVAMGILFCAVIQYFISSQFYSKQDYN